MNRHILTAAMALAWCGQAAACDCTPDSLAFQDTFFKYCDEARAAYAAEAAFAEEGGAVQPAAAGPAAGIVPAAPPRSDAKPPVSPELASARGRLPQ